MSTFEVCPAHIFYLVNLGRELKISCVIIDVAGLGARDGSSGLGLRTLPEVAQALQWVRSYCYQASSAPSRPGSAARVYNDQEGMRILLSQIDSVLAPSCCLGDEFACHEQVANLDKSDGPQTVLSGCKSPPDIQAGKTSDPVTATATGWATVPSPVSDFRSVVLGELPDAPFPEGRDHLSAGLIE